MCQYVQWLIALGYETNLAEPGTCWWCMNNEDIFSFDTSFI